MPTLSVYRLHFRAGLHLGVRGVNLEEAAVALPSDTLFSALVDGWRRLGGDVAAWLAPFCADPPDPPFLLTSTFPFVGDVRFYPMPVDPHRLFARRETSGEQCATSGKGVKRIRYLSEQLFRHALEGEKLDPWVPPDDEKQQNATNGLTLQAGALWLTHGEVERLPEWVRFADKQRKKRALSAYPRLDIWKTGRTPRVTVDRLSSASTIFHIGHVRYAPECGLWMGVVWRHSDRKVAGTEMTYAASVAAILALLEDEGIGGDRGVGYGVFTLGDKTQEQTTLPDAKAGGMAWLLSRYHPRNAQEAAGLLAPAAAYRLTSVAGWLRSPDAPAQRRKRVYLLEEGSWLQVNGGGAGDPTPLGDLVNVAPEYADSTNALPHPVYRAGFGVAIGLAKEAPHG